MSFLAIEVQEAHAQNVSISQDSLSVDLVDGRTIIVPLLWYPRLWHGTPEEHNNFEIIGNGTIIHCKYSANPPKWVLEVGNW